LELNSADTTNFEVNLDFFDIPVNG
jgi:hypothetical protein